jgi:hypothetical protein
MPEAKIYYQGTQNDFDTWHTWVCDPTRANIPDGGRINKILNTEKPDNQRTTTYSDAIAHPTNADDFIWFFGDYPKADMGLTEYTLTEAITSGHIVVSELQTE